MKQNEHIDKSFTARSAKAVLESLAVKKDSQEPGHITEVTYSKDSQPTLKRVPSVEEVFFTDLANRISALEEREERMAKAVISLIMRIDDMEKKVGIRQ